MLLAIYSVTSSSPCWWAADIGVSYIHPPEPWLNATQYFFAGAAARTHASIVALPWPWLSLVQVWHCMHLRLFKSDGENSFKHYTGQLSQVLAAVLQLISLFHGSVEYNCKHCHVCFWQMHILNGFPGEKSLRWPDVMGTRLQVQAVKVKIKVSFVTESHQQQRHEHFVNKWH